MAIPEKSESDIDIPDSPSVAIHQNSSILPWDASFWGSDPQEKLKLVINLAYASIGLSFLSLFMHYIGHIGLIEYWGYNSDDISF